MAAGMSATVTKVSPTIGPRLRHILSGVAPLAVVLGARIVGVNNVTLDGTGLFAAGGPGGAGCWYIKPGRQSHSDCILPAAFASTMIGFKSLCGMELTRLSG